MTRRSWLLPAGLGMAVVLAASCAPVDPPSQKSETSNERTQIASQPHFIPPGKDPIKLRIESAVEQARQRKVLTTNGFWTVFHAILGLGPSLELEDPKTKQRVNALDFICDGGQLPGLRFERTGFGLDVHTEPNFISQGHQDQFIAEMAQWGIAPDRKFRLGKDTYTYLDFVRHSQMRASLQAKQELSWAIVVIGQYLGTDTVWTNSTGEKLHYEDLVRYEARADIEEAACGGTHRLFGLAWAHHLHLQKGGRTEGVWKEAADRLEKYKQLAKDHRNPDGSFSTSFFKARGNIDNKQLRMNTTGHIFEWLALALSDAELKQSWMQDAANRLALMFQEIQNEEMDTGSLYHAIHGLLMYYARVYDPGWLGPNRPYMILPPGERR